MNKMKIAIAVLLALPLCAASSAPAVPPDFIEEVFTTGFLPVGLTFAPDGRLFYWDRLGRVYTRTLADEGPQLVIDITDEVGNHDDMGLLGLAIAPDFYESGHLYLLYKVDWEYWITGGDPDPGEIDNRTDSFGRLVRYTCTWDEGFENVKCGERVILIGVGHDNGIPILSSSHGLGALAFARDGTLLASAGDGACFANVKGVPDVGGIRNGICSDNSGEAKGVVREAERVGAYRSQLIDSYCGKILRLDVSNIDPKLGVAGVPSNPYYDAEAPYAPRSKVWALGFRNPFRFKIRPGTGSTDPADGDPGVMYVADVGWNGWEELDIVRGPAQNHGWPVYEGLDLTPEYPDYEIANLDTANPRYDGKTCDQEHFFFTDLLVQETLNEPAFPNPCDAAEPIDPAFTHMHRRPAITYRHFNVITRVPGFDEDGNPIEYDIDDPESPVQGEHFNGRVVMVGAFYTGNRWPAPYRGSFMFGDAIGLGNSRGSLRYLTIDTGTDQPTAVTPFRDIGDSFMPVDMAFDPSGEGLYTVNFLPSQIRLITYDCNGNGVRDKRDIENGDSEDDNGNGIPDECECTGDVDESGEVDFNDILRVLAAWGPCGDPCPEDGDGNDVVDFNDILLVLAAWGPCE